MQPDEIRGRRQRADRDPSSRRPYRLLDDGPDPASFVIGVMLAAVLSAAVFAHASKRGNAHPTAWGVVVFLFAGIAVPVYFIRFWLQRRNSD
jgi:hypothetical protein